MAACPSGGGRLFLVDAIQDPVDEAAGLVGAELLRDLERLVDRHLGRHAGRPAQLEDRLPEDVAVHHRHPLELPVLRVALDQLVDLGLVALGPAHEGFGELPRLGIHRMPHPEVVEVRLGLPLALDVHLVEELERELPRLAPAAHQRPAFRPRSERSQPAISSAARAASSPRLPTTPPARSHACSSVSAVITPKVTGTPVSSATRLMPCAATPHT